jgi:cyclic beta-1,2-glucan glucanotransferase
MNRLENETIAAVAVGVGPSGFFADAHGTEPVRAEIFGLDRLEIHARHLAAHTKAARVVTGRPLLQQFVRNRRSLLRAYRQISAAYRRKETFGPDAEWLLDNFHIVSEALFEVHTDLPRGYYRQLPKIAAGPLRGLPRVYAVAVEMVAHGDSSLDENHLARFVNAFQTVAPLTIGELWAFPIMLRLVLVDNLRRLAEQILRARDHRHNAAAWAARFLAVPPGQGSGVRGQGSGAGDLRAPDPWPLAPWPLVLCRIPLSCSCWTGCTSKERPSRAGLNGWKAICKGGISRRMVYYGESGSARRPTKSPLAIA